MHKRRALWAVRAHRAYEELVIKPERLVVRICAGRLLDELELAVEHSPPPLVVRALLLELPRDQLAPVVPRGEVGQVHADKLARVRQLVVRPACVGQVLEVVDDEAPVRPAVEVAAVADEHFGNETELLGPYLEALRVG